mmetsp:Transcript_38457/g.38825  ORF Transcript_38457/g.38825 Transcript_38457/m.38825 type:complete len:126 (+) Transcript_38457:1139-1516(+)
MGHFTIFSFLFALRSFYMTWTPYLALQFLWASKKAFGNYSFILYAGTVVPLQGVWNFFVYARNRQLQSLSTELSAWSTEISSRISTRISSINVSFRRSSGSINSITQQQDPTSITTTAVDQTKRK